MKPDDSTTRCAYCGATIKQRDNLPAFVDDDDAWRQRAKHHAPDCEWILTRAHRLPEDRP